MNDIFKDLFEYDTLYKMLVCAKKVSKEATEKEIFEVYDNWLRINKRFRSEIAELNSDQRTLFKQQLQQEFSNLNIDKAFFAFDSIKLHLKRFLLSQQKDKKKGILDQMLQEIEDNKPKLTPLSFQEFINKDDKKEYYIKNLFAKGTINMIFSPPASMKSFVSYYMSLCLSQGINFLNQKTKQVNVCYFDWENPISDVQNRIKGMCKGLNKELNEIDNLYFFPKQPTLLRVNNYDSYVMEELKEQLLEFIKDNEIKVLFFDTLRRLGNFDENDSGAINTIKSELFDPLINECEVCIIFLHHTNKEGKDYRGSVDIEGILDTAYSIKKVCKEDSISLTLTNTKRRNNELEQLKCSVTIENEDYEDDGEMYERITNVQFGKLAEEDVDESGEYKAYKDFMIDSLIFGQKYKNKELAEMLSYTFGIASSRTQNKIIKWLVDINILKSFGDNRSKYYILNPAHSKREENIQLKELEKHFFNLFKDNDLVSIDLLKGKFEEKYYSLLVADWVSKGWVFESKKGYLSVTDLFKSEHPSDEIDLIEEDLI